MRIEVSTASGHAHVELDRPRGQPLQALLVLTHGANGLPHTADLLAVRAAALRAGVAVALVTQAYRVAGRTVSASFGPQDEAWRLVVDTVRRRRGLRGVPLVVGGRSNGARVACRTARDCGASAVLALAFPLHPPGRPEKTRLAELEGAGVAVLVVQGDRDPFGLPPAGEDRQVIVVPGADHSLKRDPNAVAAATMTFVTTIIARAKVQG